MGDYRCRECDKEFELEGDEQADVARCPHCGAPVVEEVDDEKTVSSAKFLEPPPDVGARGLAGLMELLRIGKRVRSITGDEIAEMIAFRIATIP